MTMDDKLAALRSQLTDEQDLSTVSAWQKKVRTSMLNQDLSKHDGVKIILRELSRKVNQCNLVLREDRDLSDAERKLIFTKRDCWEWLINLFSSSEKTLKTMEERINEELSQLNESPD